MFITVIWCFYTVQNDAPDKSRCHLSPSKIITVLLTTFPMLYITSQGITYFITGILYLLLLICFAPPITNSLFPVSIINITSWEWAIPFIHQNGLMYIIFLFVNTCKEDVLWSSKGMFNYFYFAEARTKVLRAETA